MVALGLAVALCLVGSGHAVAPHPPGAAAPRPNRYGIGIYNDTAAPSLSLQLPEASALVGEGGSVLLFFNLLFRTDGDPSSCENGCLPLPWQLAAVRQAYALELRPVVRLGQWSRRIRDFADGGESGPRSSFKGLAQRYRRFVAALPRPPDGRSPLRIQLLNEPNVCGEWQCLGHGPASRLSATTAAAEVASCLRDLVSALRDLPRLALSAAPLAQVGFARCECTPPFKPTVPQNATAVSFAAAMLAAVPELYDDVDFLTVHAYPEDWRFGFDSPAGRAGISSYRPLRDFVNAHRRGRIGDAATPLPIVVGETGWQGPNQTLKAESFVSALTEVFFADAAVTSVLPFMLANWGQFERVWPWTRWPVNATAPAERYAEWESTRALRCSQGVGRTGCGSSTTLAAASTSVTVTSGGSGERGPPRAPALSSVFLDTLSGCLSWPPERFTREVRAMAAIGIENVILTPLARLEPSGRAVAYYNTSALRNTAVLGDVATPLLAAAAEAGLTVTLGLQLRSFSEVYKLDATAAHRFFMDAGRANVAMVGELARLGGRFGATTWAGFYNPHEINDKTWISGASRPLFGDFVDSCLKPTHEAVHNSGARGVIAPGFGFAGIDASWGPANVSAFWTKVLAMVPRGLDVLAVQDNVGIVSDPTRSDPSNHTGRFADPAKVAPFIKAIAAAARTQGKEAWVDVEVFSDYADGTSVAAPFARVLRQMAVEGPHAAALTAWEWSEYLSPSAEGNLYREYKAWWAESTARTRQKQDDDAAGKLTTAHSNMGRLLDGYGDSMYRTMRDDKPRTAAYTAAIQRLAPGRVVLDIGTGQFALLATIAARAGARYVYAIEGNRQAYERAKEAVAAQGLADRIGVLFGYSANVSLQELPRADGAASDAAGEGAWGVELVIHELLGEIAGMEGAAFAIHDAHRRHLLPPPAPLPDGAAPRRVSIPHSATSFIAPTAFPPASYWSALPTPVIVSPGTTFLKVWDFPEASLLSDGWEEFEVLQFDRPGTLATRTETTSEFVVRSEGDDERFAGFVCYMSTDLAGPGSHEIDTLRDSTHWAQQLILFDGAAVREGDVITLRSTVDNTRGPFTVYTFVASLMRDGTAAPLGTVVLDDHY